MANVYCAIYGNSNDWDGTTHWGMNPVTEEWCADQNERDNGDGDGWTEGYTSAYPSLSAWETARDGVAQAADTEYAIIFGPWTAHDTAKLTFAGWTNPPTEIIIQTLGTDARSQDGKFGSNSCYVLENDDAIRCVDVDQTGHTLTFTGIQFEITNTAADTCIWNDNAANLTVDKCFFYENGDQGARGIYSVSGTAHDVMVVNSIFRDCMEGIKGNTSTGTGKVYNCTLEGCAYDCIEDDGGVWTVKNCAVFNNVDDFDAVDVIDWCASDQGAGEGDNGLDISGTWDTTCFTDQGNGDYSIEVDSPLKDASDLSQFDDADVPSDDICGNPRNIGEGETVSIGAYEYVAVGPEEAIKELLVGAGGMDGGSLGSGLNPMYG